MQILCWNINVRKNNPAHFPYQEVADAMNGAVDTAQPWLLVVLENKIGGNDVAAELMRRLGGTSCECISAGGGPNTTENILLIAKGITIDSVATVDDWRFGFDVQLEDSRDGYIRTIPPLPGAEIGIGIRMRIGDVPRHRAGGTIPLAPEPGIEAARR